MTMISTPLPDKTMNLEIDHRAKTFRKSYSSGKGDVGMEAIAKLGEFSGQPDRDLGTKEIDGKKSRGFEIDVGKLFGDPHRSVGPAKTLEVWIDSKSSLPVLVQSKWKDDRSEITVRIQDLQWNIDLDPKLFNVTLPKGYTADTSSQAVPPPSRATKSGSR